MFRFMKHLEELVFQSEPGQLRQVRTMVVWHANRAGLDAETVDGIELAVGEACANALEHGSPLGIRNQIRVRCMKNPRRFVVEIEDEGSWRIPAEPAEGEVSLRGRGLMLMREMVDEVEVHPSRTGTRVRLSVRRPAVRQRPARIPLNIISGKKAKVA